MDGTEGNRSPFSIKSPNRLCWIAIAVVMGFLLVANMILLIVLGIDKLSSVDSAAPGYVTSKSTDLSLTETKQGRPKKGELIFRDEFNSFNLDTWEHEITMSGGGNGEFQMYVNNRSNSYVKFGKLYIRPTLTSDQYGEDMLTNGKPIVLGGGAPADKCTNEMYHGCSRVGSLVNPINPIKSARIRTLNSFSFKYGKVEVKAKIPAGDWLWPAIWMMPEKNQYGGWPASGEIDLMESRGNLELYQACATRERECHNGNRNIGAERVGSTLHFGPFWPQNGYEKAHYSKYSSQSEGFNQEFHLYQLEWTPEHIKFSVDDKEIGKTKTGDGGFWDLAGFSDKFENPWAYSENSKMAPFDQRFYLIINLAVGGTNGFFPENTKGNIKKPWNNNSPQATAQFWDAREEWYDTWERENAALQVDYVRVWAL